MPVARASSSAAQRAVGQEVGDAQLGRRVDAPRDMDPPDHGAAIRGGRPALVCGPAERVASVSAGVLMVISFYSSWRAASSRERRIRLASCRLLWLPVPAYACRQAHAPDAWTAGRRLHAGVPRPWSSGGHVTAGSRWRRRRPDPGGAGAVADRRQPRGAGRPPGRRAVARPCARPRRRQSPGPAVRAAPGVSLSWRVGSTAVPGPPDTCFGSTPASSTSCGSSSWSRTGRDALASGDADRAVRLLDQALALWRGPALADLDDGPVRERERARLEEERLGALESRVEAQLALRPPPGDDRGARDADRASSAA